MPIPPLWWALSVPLTNLQPGTPVTPTSPSFTHLNAGAFLIIQRQCQSIQWLCSSVLGYAQACPSLLLRLFAPLTIGTTTAAEYISGPVRPGMSSQHCNRRLYLSTDVRG